MSVIKPISPISSSVASSQLSGVDDMDTAKVKSYIKDLLKSRIFLGRYVERRLANQRIGYRDVVLLSAAEVELKKDLLDALYKLRSTCPNTHWIGITDAEPLHPSGVCLWTEIDNQPFGPFWFQIRSIKFRDEEVIVILKCLRYISDSVLELEPILTGAAKKTYSTARQGQPDVSTKVSSTSFNDTYAEIVETLKGIVTVTNVKEFVTFVFAFIIALFTGSTAFVNFLGNFILALLRELSIFVKNFTPWFLGFLDFLSKIVGGFYILLAMFFRQSSPVPQNRRAVPYYNRRSTDSSDYNRRSSTSYDDRNFD